MLMALLAAYLLGGGGVSGGILTVPAVKQMQAKVEVHVADADRAAAAKAELASFSDLVENLEFALMAALRGDHGRWAWVLDAQLIELENTETLGLEVGSDMTILELDLAYELRDGLEVFGGARYVDVEGRLALLLPAGPVRAGAGDSWTDPVIGARAVSRLGRDWRLLTRLDVGGFGVGSDFSWGFLATAEYRFSERLRWGIGYRILDIDYDEGRGADRFVFDTRQAGLITGVRFGF